MRTQVRQSLYLVIVVLLLAGCSTANAKEQTVVPSLSPTATPIPVPSDPDTRPGAEQQRALVDLVLLDLHSRLGDSVVVTAQQVIPTEFSDSSLGVPEPGKAYAQVLTPGYVIRVTVGQEVYEYHAAGEKVILASIDAVATATVTIESVQVTADTITVSGKSTYSDGTSIQSELLVNGQGALWWPESAHAIVEDGAWQMSVPIDGTSLDRDLEYTVYAWAANDDSSRVGFPFDLAGPPTPPPAHAVVYQTVTISEVGLTVEVPSNWKQIEGEWIWTPDETRPTHIGVRWIDIQPPVEPEAALLPQQAQIVDSQPNQLGWGTGRRFEVEVYGDAPQDGSKAFVQAVEVHNLVLVDQKEGRRAFDLYATAPTMDELDALRPLLQHLVDTSTLAAPVSTPEPMVSTPEPTAPSRPEGWQTFQDETYGYAFSYPPDWTVKELEMDGPGMPDDWPIVRSVQAFPSEWAEQLDNSGPPDPTRPPVVAPLNIEVCIGPLEQYQRAYPAPDQSETMVVHGIEVSVERDISSEQITQIRYLFQSPVDGELRVVINDMLTGFAKRITGNESVAEMIPTIVETVHFVK